MPTMTPNALRRADGPDDQAYAKKLASAMPPLYWFRDGVIFDGGIVEIRASVALFDRRKDPSDLVATIEGQPAELEVINDNPLLADRFWFVPQDRFFTVGLRAELDYPQGCAGEDSTAYVQAALRFAGDEDSDVLYQFQSAPNFLEFSGTPPVENIERVSGKGATASNYWNNGRTDYTRFNAIARMYDVDTENPDIEVLDWGCGCGRLTRHWQSRSKTENRVLGADIDPDNIQWCRQHLSSNYEKFPLHPPTELSDSSFDLIVGNSVLTHLRKDVLHAWLRELARLLKPEGLALLSYHGDFSTIAFCSRTPEFVNNVWSSGFSDALRADEVNDQISDSDYYRHTYMTEEHAQELFTTYFDLEDTYVGIVSRFQNIAVLRKRRMPLKGKAATLSSSTTSVGQRPSKRRRRILRWPL